MAKSNALDDSQTTEVAPIDPTTASVEEFNKLYGIGDYVPDSYDDLDSYFESLGGLIEFRGSVWELVKDKSTLIGKPFVIADIRFYEGKFGDACAILAMTDNNDRIVFNDGSTGIFAQARSMVAVAKRRGGFKCLNGLRVSEYEYQRKDLDGNPMVDPKTGELIPATPARTYYIA